MLRPLLPVVTGSDSSICMCSIEQRKGKKRSQKKTRNLEKKGRKIIHYHNLRSCTFSLLHKTMQNSFVSHRFCSVSNQPFKAVQFSVKWWWVRRRPTRLSSPPPRRSMAPICMPAEGGGGPVVVGGVRSRLSRSPRRSPWDGMTDVGASVETPAAEFVSGLSALSPLQARGNSDLLFGHISRALFKCCSTACEPYLS